MSTDPIPPIQPLAANSVPNSNSWSPKAPVPEETQEPEKPPIQTDKEVKAAWLVPFRFKPGQSGNPNGRPKTTPLTDALRWTGHLPCPPKTRRSLEKTLGVKLPKSLTMFEATAIGQHMKAILNTPTAEWVGNRTDGKVREEVRFTGLEGMGGRIPDITFQFVEMAADGKPIRVIDIEAPPPMGEEPNKPPKPTNALAPLDPPGNGANGTSTEIPGSDSQ
jgi:hypothetical protein